jgi:hypothetical protein
MWVVVVAQGVIAALFLEKLLEEGLLLNLH